jgi:hypothetical protein
MNSDTMIDPIEALDSMLERGEDIYEIAVDIGIQNETELTRQRWLQGDLTLRVEGAYGDDIITKFATALNVNTSTLKQRRTISKFYKTDTRYLFDNLGYSHYREAMRWGDIDRAMESLNHASEYDLPVWKFKEFMDNGLGKDRLEHTSAEGTIFCYAGQIDGKYIIEIAISEDDAKWLKDADRVVIRAKT